MSSPFPVLPGRIILSHPGPARYTAVPTPGPPGAQGEIGPPGDLDISDIQELIDDSIGAHVVADEPHPALRRYVHTQTTPSASWVIDHGLGKPVQVSIFDSTDPPWNLVYTDVDHGSLDQTTITFPTPVSGLAVLS